MKLAALVPLVSVALLLSLSVTVGCTHPQKRNDWRSPAPSMQGRACSSDADCSGGTCAIDLGASQGTCSGPNSTDRGGPGDGGAPNPGPNPGPNVQPSPSDIQI